MKSTALITAAAIAMICVFSAAALAGPNEPAGNRSAKQRIRKIRRICYVMTSASGIPEPCDRIRTPIPTTAIPLQIIGNH
jgi:hypothetical protein